MVEKNGVYRYKLFIVKAFSLLRYLYCDWRLVYGVDWWVIELYKMFWLLFVGEYFGVFISLISFVIRSFVFYLGYRFDENFLGVGGKIIG